MERLNLKILSRIHDKNQFPSLEKYLEEIHKKQQISQEEEKDLARKIKEGDQTALEKLIEANLGLVVSVAKQYQGLGLLLPDLISEGNIGLIKAAKKFDEKKGNKFISYAVLWIRGSILNALEKDPYMIPVPREFLNQIKKFVSNRKEQSDRPPTIDEIVNELVEVLRKKPPKDLKKIFLNSIKEGFSSYDKAILEIKKNSNNLKKEFGEKMGAILQKKFLKDIEKNSSNNIDEKNKLASTIHKLIDSIKELGEEFEKKILENIKQIHCRLVSSHIDEKKESMPTIDEFINEITKAFEKNSREEIQNILKEQWIECIRNKVIETLLLPEVSISINDPTYSNIFPFGEKENLSVLDRFSNENAPTPDNQLMRESLQCEIKHSISTLTERERNVIKLYFGIGEGPPLSFEDIGSKFKLTYERVRQIKEKAIQKLRKNPKNKLLRAYLG